MIHLVTGAAGFIGSHLTDRLIGRGDRVIGLDNLRLGRRSNLAHVQGHPRFTLIEADLNDCEANVIRLRPHLRGERIEVVWHLTANSDIRAGTQDPDVDFRETFLTTHRLLQLMRRLDAANLAFASSSAIYGPHPGALDEDAGPLRPVSNYGAMKLASEAAISAALETQLSRVWIFRFPNVVGSRATHGVIYDFVRKLQRNPHELEVLGDGCQEKPYLHVAELVDAMLWIQTHGDGAHNVVNIGPAGPGTRVSAIAERVVQRVSPGARIRYGGGAQGWPGDVPRFQYSIERLCRLGWTPHLTSDQAVERAVAEVADDLGA